MVAGHLQKKNGHYYMVVSYQSADGQKAVWKATGLKVTGNKMKAEAMLLKFRRSFVIPEELGIEPEKEIINTPAPAVKEEQQAPPVPAAKEEQQDPPVPTVEEYVHKYLKSIRYTITGRTLESRIYFAKHIVKRLGKYKVTELNKGIIQDFIFGFAAKPYIKNKKGDKEHYSQDIINKVYDLTRAIVNELIEEEYLSVDIMLRVKKPKSKKIISKPKNQALTKSEVKKLLNLIKSDVTINTIIIMLLFLGVRPGELFALKWSDIDKRNRTIKITRTLSEEPIFNDENEKIKTLPSIQKIKNDNGGINFAIRTLSFSPMIESVLDKWYAHINGNKKLLAAKIKAETTDYMFCNTKNGELARPEYHLRYYRNFLKNHGHEYNEFNLYRCRHTFATNALKKGLDIKTVQMMLGDNDPEMVLKVYANLTRKEILEAHERFSAEYETELIELCC